MEDPVEVSAGLLRHLSKALDSLTPDDRAALLAGDSVLRLVVEPKTRGRKVPEAVDVPDLGDIRARLEGCRSREEATKILEDLSLAKTALQQLIKVLDLPYLKSDSVPRLIDRIIDATVGFRLRSQAIQGTQNASAADDVKGGHQPGTGENRNPSAAQV